MTNTATNPSAPNPLPILNSQPSTLVPVSLLHPHPRNVNIGDMDAIASSIDENGFYGALIVQRSTGYILAGKHRYAHAVRRGATQLPVIYLDVDDDRALRIMLADNRTSRLGHDEDKALLDLLNDLSQSEHGLIGTAFSNEDLSELLRSVNGTGAIDTNPDTSSKMSGLEYRLVVLCHSEQHQAELMSKLESDGLKCQVLIS